MKKLTALVVTAITTVVALQSFAEDMTLPLWGEIDPGIRIASVRLRTETDMESASRSVKEADGTYSIALIDRMIDLIPLTQTGEEYHACSFSEQFRELKCMQDELISAGFACDPQITWLGSYGDDKATVIKRAMITKVGVLLGCEEPTLTAWVGQVMTALDAAQ